MPTRLGKISRSWPLLVGQGPGVTLGPGLEAAEAADPDLELGVLLSGVEHAVVAFAVVDLASQGLDLADGQEDLGFPEQAIVAGKLGRAIGKQVVKLAPERMVLFASGLELVPRLVHFVESAVELGLGGFSQFGDLAMGVGDVLLGGSLLFDGQAGQGVGEFLGQLFQKRFVGFGLGKIAKPRGPNLAEPLIGQDHAVFSHLQALGCLPGFRTELLGAGA